MALFFFMCLLIALSSNGGKISQMSEFQIALTKFEPLQEFLWLNFWDMTPTTSSNYRIQSFASNVKLCLEKLNQCKENAYQNYYYLWPKFPLLKYIMKEIEKHLTYIQPMRRGYAIDNISCSSAYKRWTRKSGKRRTGNQRHKRTNQIRHNANLKPGKK